MVCDKAISVEVAEHELACKTFGQSLWPDDGSTLCRGDAETIQILDHPCRDKGESQVVVPFPMTAGYGAARHKLISHGVEEVGIVRRQLKRDAVVIGQHVAIGAYYRISPFFSNDLTNQ